MTARWNRIRAGILLVTLAGVTLALLAAQLFPKPLERLVPSFSFPSTIPLSGWELDASFAVTEHDPRGFPMRAGYRTTGSRTPMTVEMRYTPDIRNLYEGGSEMAAAILPSGYLPLDIGMRVLVDTHGRLRRNANDVVLDNTPAEVRHRVGLGSYIFWSADDRMHLSAVVGPSGEGMVMRQEFSRALYGEMARVRPLLRGSVGLAPLPDPRAVIVDFSTPAAAISPETARQRLEEAWFQWQPWCARRFPKPDSE